MFTVVVAKTKPCGNVFSVTVFYSYVTCDLEIERHCCAERIQLFLLGPLLMNLDAREIRTIQ